MTVIGRGDRLKTCILEGVGVTAHGRKERDVVWWLAAPFAVRLLALLASIAPASAATPFALFGSPHDRFAGLSGLGAVIGATLGAYWRDNEFWHLDRPSRAVVLRAQFTGRPSGDSDLDELAAYRLSHAAQSSRANRVALLVTATLLVAVLLVAAARSTPWWLLGLLPSAPTVSVLCWLALRYHPRTRLTKLQERG